MIKCPNCGSTAQIRVIHSNFIEDGCEIEKVSTYKCGCGCLFMTSTLYEAIGSEEILNAQNQNFFPS